MRGTSNCSATRPRARREPVPCRSLAASSASGGLGRRSRAHSGALARPGWAPLRPATVWLTGLSGAGKTTIARALVRELEARGVPCEHLDGDDLRAIFPSTGFTPEDRNLHVRWVGFLASCLERHGVVVIVSMISPYRDGRSFARGRSKHFVEVHVCTALEICEARDVKGLYARARRGEILCFTGVSDPYEAPVAPELLIDTSVTSTDQAARMVLAALSSSEGEQAHV